MTSGGYVALTPEEWVRQNFIRYLVSDKSYPPSLIAIEKQFKYNRLVKRSDILVYNRDGVPVLMIECKGPEIKINQEVFDQIALYNLKFNVPYLIVTNGINHYCCSYESEQGKYKFLEKIPDYPLLSPGD